MADKGRYTTTLTDAVALSLSHVTHGPRFSNCWLPASTWVEALTKSNHIDSSINIDVRKFNAAMSRSPLFGEAMHRFDGTNTTGVFRARFQKKRFYFFTEASKQVCYPCPFNNAWKDKVVEAASNVLVISSTRSSTAALDIMPQRIQVLQLLADCTGSEKSGLQFFDRILWSQGTEGNTANGSMGSEATTALANGGPNHRNRPAHNDADTNGRKVHRLPRWPNTSNIYRYEFPERL